MTKHMFAISPGPFPNGLDSSGSEMQKLQAHIQQLEFKVNTMATVRRHYWHHQRILVYQVFEEDG